VQVAQVQSVQAQFAQLSLQWAQAHTLWLHVAQVQSAQEHWAHRSAQSPHEQVVHSS
jgi:hypothetical protein